MPGERRACSAEAGGPTRDHHRDHPGHDGGGKKLPEPLQTILAIDEPLYGMDEILALGITNVYGSIGLTNFGYLDKRKPLVIGRLNRGSAGVHVFLDDLVAGIAAAASARIAHRLPDGERFEGDV